jgi:bifunctional DNA-binding transcriptional regulator/antitoxin component of YhaV-PrlF toxin-antitoxin module
MTTVSVSPKFQITLTEEVRKFLPQIKPGTKVILGYDPEFDRIIVKPQEDWMKFKGIAKSKVKFTSHEEEKAAIEASRAEYYKEKYGRS